VLLQWLTNTVLVAGQVLGGPVVLPGVVSSQHVISYNWLRSIAGG
jgi:hypothetical protein